MKKNFKWLVLSGVLLFYAFLYIATTKDYRDAVPPACDEVCEKIQNVDSLIRMDFDSTATYQCHTDAVCVIVYGSLIGSHKGLADTACMYLNNEGLKKYTINIIDYPSLDTLVKQTCP